MKKREYLDKIKGPDYRAPNKSKPVLGKSGMI